MTIPIEREAILPRLNGIHSNIERLRKLGELSFENFHQGDSYDLAQHHLRLALEGIFNIGSHILSRLPGGRAVEYQEIAEKLGEFKIVDPAFAKEKLVLMERLRNLLVHQYADLDPRRLYDIVQHHLDDVEIFLTAIRTLLEDPKSFGLSIQ